MQRAVLFLAYFFICVNCFSQQYPFVHYSPKDGLVSNRVRSIYQDSKGRMYFLSMNGLSIYDGARFTNYSTENGLENDIVNCVMEMGDDSIWVATNTNKINYFIKGKLQTLSFNSTSTPVINYLCRSNADLYVAADEGLFRLHQKEFIKLPFSDLQGTDINNYIASIVSVDNYLLCLRDPGLGGAHILYLYDCRLKKIVSQTDNIIVLNVAQSKDGRLWASTNNGIRQLDKTELLKGKITLQQLPVVFNSIADKVGLLFFDNDDNCWMVEGNQALIKCDKKGNTAVYTSASGLSTPVISFVFHDREGIIWLASNGGGIDKLMHTNFSVIEEPFGLTKPADLFLSASKEVLLYSYHDKKIVHLTGNNVAEISFVENANEIVQLIETPNGLYGIGLKKIFRLRKKKSSWLSEIIFADSSVKGFGFATTDPAGNLLVAGHHYLTAIVKDTVFRIPVNYLADQIASDGKENIWLANRTEELVHYKIHPDNPSAYLQEDSLYEKKLLGMAPRSIALDKHGNIWLGTRNKGILIFKNDNGKLSLLYHLTSRNGLSENFVSFLVCDEDNIIWACTPSGLDKIIMKNGSPVVENLTRQNNIYQGILKVVIDKNKTTWALFPSGIIRIIPESNKVPAYIPKLLFTQIRSGTDTINETAPFFSYKQNNFNFQFAAPSFMDEKQILYSYQLEGSTTNEWTVPSNNATASFIDLRPGNYTLNIRAKFPAARYPDQLLQYQFSISPPWWQSWWFRIIAALIVATGFVSIIRFYYRRKLEKQTASLEKQQAIEKERTRIATDIHDDLGAGITRIKFLSENISEQLQEHSDKTQLSKLKDSANELVEKMSEIIWAMNEKNDSWEDLVFYLRSYAIEYCNENKLNCRFNIPEELPHTLAGGQIRRNIFLILKECLHNIVKHAKAKNVFITIWFHPAFEMKIQDDGHGFEVKELGQKGNGLINIQKRAKNIGGTIAIANHDGTLISFTAPL